MFQSVIVLLYKFHSGYKYVCLIRIYTHVFSNINFLELRVFEIEEKKSEHGLREGICIYNYMHFFFRWFLEKDHTPLNYHALSFSWIVTLRFVICYMLCISVYVIRLSSINGYVPYVLSIFIVSASALIHKRRKSSLLDKSVSIICIEGKLKKNFLEEGR